MAERAIELVEYDARWPALFDGEADRIRGAVAERVVAIHHVGSTAVPGLAAKPIVDVCLVVADARDEVAYVPALEAAGYLLRRREPEWYEHRLFRRREPEVNLHVYSEHCAEVDRMILFRDRLRTHPEELELYLQTKRRLAARAWSRVQDYADAKSGVVEAILARARSGS